jgi:hypothetical protein
LRRAFAAVLLAFWSCTAGAQDLTAPREHVRGPEQTFLTFPEWFLVFSPAEYAGYVKDRAPTQFPFLGHVGQFWSSYAEVARKASAYPMNAGYHVMILVIGVSTTVEYGLRAAYETLIGRVSEASAGGTLTPEDRVGARVAQEYVDFIRVSPWYDFDFVTPLKRLWAEPAMGEHFLRKWERRYALTTEYVVKAGYGWAIRKATHASYEAPILVTAAVVKGLPEGYAAKDEQVLERRPDGRALLLIPRYQAFTDHALALVRTGATFEEIAGNRGEILVSAIAPPGKAVPRGGALFAQPLITQPGGQRIARVVPISMLAADLELLLASGLTPEHIFDY